MRMKRVYSLLALSFLILNPSYSTFAQTPTPVPENENLLSPKEGGAYGESATIITKSGDELKVGFYEEEIRQDQAQSLPEFLNSVAKEGGNVSLTIIEGENEPLELPSTIANNP